MSTWNATCQSCGVEYEVEASSEEDAIQKAEQEHEERNAKATIFRCDMGPMITRAFNLTEPTHPCAPKDW